MVTPGAETACNDFETTYTRVPGLNGGPLCACTTSNVRLPIMTVSTGSNIAAKSTVESFGIQSNPPFASAMKPSRLAATLYRNRRMRCLSAAYLLSAA